MKTTIYIKETETGNETIVATIDHPETPFKGVSVRQIAERVKQAIRNQMDNDKTILNDFVRQCSVLLKYNYITPEQYNKIKDDLYKT